MGVSVLRHLIATLAPPCLGPASFLLGNFRAQVYGRGGGRGALMKKAKDVGACCVNPYTSGSETFYRILPNPAKALPTHNSQWVQIESTRALSYPGIISAATTNQDQI